MVRLLGSGAFATVLLAHDDALDAPVAVKVLAENWAHRLDVHERFLQEAQILRRCDSPNVVQVYDLGDLDDGRPYFVMALADRGTLADRLARESLDVPTALRYATEAAAGVAALHDIGVIHRDVKPSNVLLRTGRGGEERVLVADLGMAKETARASGFTLTAGTPGYMAPEQITGEGLSVRADVYGLGALLHELLTGALPGRAEPDAVPGELAAVVRRALDPDPERRYADAGEFAAALAGAGGPGDAAPAPRPRPAAASETTVGLAPTDATVAVPPPAPRRRSRRRVAVVAALVAVVVAAAAGAGTLLLVRRQSSVTVQDASRALTVTVPADWARQVQDAPWSLGRFGRTGTAAALAVAPDIGRWQEASSGARGIFVGLVPDVPATTVLAGSPHPSCSTVTQRTVFSGDLAGPARRFADCTPAGVVWDEVALSPKGGGDYTVYVQVKAGAPQQLDAVLSSLSLAVAASAP